MSEFQTQQIYGKFFGLDINPETDELKISLAESLALYKNETQIVGDQTTVAMNVDGSWETELIDTDSMNGTFYYIFEINKRIYKKLVPVNSEGWNFNDLPNMIF